MKAVVALLESDEFDSAEKMAKALIKSVADMLDMRDWYALTHRTEDEALGINWGPYGSESDAFAVAAKVGLTGKWSAVRLASPGVLLANVDGKPGAKGYCQHPGCGHATFIHLTDGSARGKCPLPTCDCPKFTK